MKKCYGCKKISPGDVIGEVIISDEPILFYHTDPATGKVTEEGHPLEGRSVSKKLVVFPGGKGSSVVQADGLYKLETGGTAPAGFIVKDLDTVLVSTAIIMEIPMVWKVEEAFYRDLRDGDRIRLNATEATIEIDRDVE